VDPPACRTTGAEPRGDTITDTELDTPGLIARQRAVVAEPATDGDERGRSGAAIPQLHQLLALPAPVVVRILALAHLRRIRQVYRRFARTGDAERLHDLRVTVRKLRSLLREYDREVKGSVRRKDRRRLRDVARATAALRELDVRFAWADEVALDGEEYAAAERLRTRTAETRGDEVTAVREQLDRMLGKLVRRLRKRLRRYTLDLDGKEAGVTGFAVALADTLTRLRHQFEEQLARASDVEDEPRIHAARIAAKRLRYAIEPAAGTVAGAAATTQLVGLQDQLGRYLDLGAGIVALDRELAAAHRDGHATVVAGLQKLLSRAKTEQAELLASVRAEWIADGAHRRLADLDTLLADVLATAGTLHPTDG
jgi:CHAD domain-containing protein